MQFVFGVTKYLSSTDGIRVPGGNTTGTGALYALPVLIDWKYELISFGDSTELTGVPWVFRPVILFATSHHLFVRFPDFNLSLLTAFTWFVRMSLLIFSWVIRFSSEVSHVWSFTVRFICEIVVCMYWLAIDFCAETATYTPVNHMQYRRKRSCS